MLFLNALLQLYYSLSIIKQDLSLHKKLLFGFDICLNLIIMPWICITSFLEVTKNNKVTKCETEEKRCS